MENHKPLLFFLGSWGQSGWTEEGYYAVGGDDRGNSYEIIRPSRRGANHYETRNGVTRRTKGRPLIHNGHKL